MKREKGRGAGISMVWMLLSSLHPIWSMDQRRVGRAGLHAKRRVARSDRERRSEVTGLSQVKETWTNAIFVPLRQFEGGSEKVEWELICTSDPIQVALFLLSLHLSINLGSSKANSLYTQCWLIWDHWDGRWEYRERGIGDPKGGSGYTTLETRSICCLALWYRRGTNNSLNGARYLIWEGVRWDKTRAKHSMNIVYRRRKKDRSHGTSNRSRLLEWRRVKWAKGRLGEKKRAIIRSGEDTVESNSHLGWKKETHMRLRGGSKGRNTALERRRIMECRRIPESVIRNCSPSITPAIPWRMNHLGWEEKMKETHGNCTEIGWNHHFIIRQINVWVRKGTWYGEDT